MTKKKLFFNAVAKFLSGIIVTGLLLFLPAGSFHYPQAWLFIIALFLPMLFFGTYLLTKSPELLEKRLNTKEKEKTQKSVIVWSGLMFLAGFVLSAFDFRFGWSQMPLLASIVSVFVMLIGYVLYIVVIKQNMFLSRTVEIQKDQHVIDTGLYGLVRHPMYFATLLCFMPIPLILGSYVGFFLFLPYPFILSARIKNEEKVLEDGLVGYREYEQKVRWRVIPYIW